MPTPAEYRKIAETYYRLAREAKTEADRLALLDLAQVLPPGSKAICAAMRRASSLLSNLAADGRPGSSSK